MAIFRPLPSYILPTPSYDFGVRSMRQQKHSVKLVKVLILRSKRHGRIEAVFGFTMGEIIFVAESFTGLGSETLDFPRYRQRGDLNLAEYTTTLKLGSTVSIRPKKAQFIQFRGGNLHGGIMGECQAALVKCHAHSHLAARRPVRLRFFRHRAGEHPPKMRGCAGAVALPGCGTIRRVGRRECP